MILVIIIRILIILVFIIYDEGVRGFDNKLELISRVLMNIFNGLKIGENFF